MKKSLLLVGIMAICSTQFIMAQEAAPAKPAPALNQATPMKPNGQKMMVTPEQRAQRQTEMMTKQLTLTGETVTKVNAINLKYAQKQDELRKSGKTREEMVKQMQQMMTDRDAELKTVLSAEQYKIYSDKRAQMGRPGMMAPQKQGGN